MHSNSVSIIQCFGLEVDACMIEFIIIACSFVSLQQIQCGFYASDPGCSLRDGSTAACMERGEVYCMMRSAVNSGAIVEDFWRKSDVCRERFHWLPRSLLGAGVSG